MKRIKIVKLIPFILAMIITILWIYPLMLILFNSFKTYEQMMTKFLAFPQTLSFITYIDAWKKMNFGNLFYNTSIYTVFSVLFVVIAASMAAYKLSRNKSRYSYLIFLFCIMPMMVPFQSYMITVTQLAKKLGLMGNRMGVIVMSAGLCMPLALFLYHGFIKNIPVQLDECAGLDGASGFTLFFRIIFPLLKPITTTVVVIDIIAVWNDFIVQLLFVGAKKKYFNIQNALYSQFSTQYTDWEHALPGLIISLIPMIIFFIVMQKHIVAGVTAGAIKE